MFNLVRRISRSFIPRPDRPWEEDPTSNAPQIGRKRRLSDSEHGGKGSSDEERLTKRGRGAFVAAAVASGETDAQDITRDSSPPTPPPQGEGVEQQGVNDVTEGVKEVELEDKEEVAPESVPLPEEVSGELDEVDATPSNDTSAGPKLGAEEDDVASSRSPSVTPQAVEEDAKEISSDLGTTVQSGPDEPTVNSSEPTPAEEAISPSARETKQSETAEAS